MRLLLAYPLLLLATTAHAIPAIRLTWDDCNVLTLDKSWSGPGPYTLVVSGVGFSGNYSRLYLYFAFNPHRVAPAWDASLYDLDGGTPCQGPSRLSATAGGGTCPAYPATARNASMHEGSITYGGQTVIQVELAFDPAFIASPDQRYELVRIVFDHANSVAGVGGPGTCGYADAAMCVNIAGGFLGLPGGLGTPFDEERGYLTWQDPMNALQCPGNATPAQAKTWGAIRAQYR